MRGGIDRTKAKAEINTWKPKSDKEIISESDDQKFILHFEKFFPKKMEKYDTFYVRKTSFEPHVAVIAKYINYFMNRYDPEGELLTAYLKLKWTIDPDKDNPDKKIIFTKENPHAFIDMIYELIFTPTMIEKINKMVDDNYLDDIEKDSSKYKASGTNDYRESLEFTNKHNKILLCISMGMKIICPIMYHYFAINNVKPKELSNRQDVTIVYDFYFPLFELFSDGVDMFNKLYVYVMSKVKDASYHNPKMFDQRKIFGDSTAVVIERFVKTRLIVDNMVKYRFNNKWNPKTGKYAENIIGLNKTILKFQIYYFRKEKYGKTLTEVTNTKNSEGLSASDKMEMNLTKIDVGIIDTATINVETVMRHLRKKIDVPVTEEELQYYRDHHYPSDVQVHFVRCAFADVFRSYRDENLLSRREYNELLVLLKKRLLLENGYEHDEVGTGCYLPYILTGNLDGVVITKQIRNNALMEALRANQDYQYLVDYKYKELEEAFPGTVDSFISMIVKTKFTYVVYEDPSLLGQPIEAPEESLCEEIVRFLKNI